VRDERVTAVARAAVATLRSTYVLLLLAVLVAAVRWRRHASGGAPDPSDRLSALGAALVPLAALALAGVLTGLVVPEPADPAVRDWVLGAQIPVVTAAVAAIAGLLTARLPWALRAAAVTGAWLLALLLAVSRVHLGWDTPSTALTSLLVGTAWSGLLLVAWHESVAVTGGVRAPAAAVPS
jgi:hypothetical protein